MKKWLALLLAALLLMNTGLVALSETAEAADTPEIVEPVPEEPVEIESPAAEAPDEVVPAEETPEEDIPEEPQPEPPVDAVEPASKTEEEAPEALDEAAPVAEPSPEEAPECEPEIAPGNDEIEEEPAPEGDPDEAVEPEAKLEPEEISGDALVELTEEASQTGIPGLVIENGVVVSYTGSETSLTLPSGVTAIGDGAFQNHTSLESISMPSGVKTIGDYAFEGCYSLAAVTIPNTVTSIGENAFEQCGGLSALTIPDSVTSIGRMAFADCSGLTNITLSNKLKTLGDTVFYGCTKLQKITLPGTLSKISGNLFLGCSNLRSITVPKGVTAIDGYAFSDCTRLETVSLPEGLTWISDRAFSGCSKLSAVTIPASIYFIGEEVFGDCTALNKVTFMNGDFNIIAYYSESNYATPLGSNTAPTIYAYSYSKAKGYASAWGFPFEELEKQAGVSVASVTTTSPVEYKKDLTFTVKTSQAAKYLAMYTEDNVKTKVWTQSASSTLEGSYRVWTVSYAFTGMGSRTMTFRTSKNGIYSYGKTVKFTVTPPAIDSISFSPASAEVGDYVTFTVKTHSGANFLSMFLGSSRIMYWAAGGNSTVSGNTRVWKVKYNFNNPGNRQVTFKASVASSGPFGSGKNVTVPILPPSVISASVDTTDWVYNHPTNFTVVTSVAAKYISVYAESGGRVYMISRTDIDNNVKPGDYGINGEKCTWVIPYSCTSPGSHTWTIKASVTASGSRGAGKTVSFKVRQPNIYAVNIDSIMGSGHAYVQETLAASVFTDGGAKYLAMYDKNGNKLKAWSAAKCAQSDSSYTENGLVWTISFTLAEAGTHKLTFKATATNVYDNGLTITVNASLPAAPSNISAYDMTVPSGHVEFEVGDSTYFEVYTPLGMKYLAMYGESGSLIHRWDADVEDCHEDGGKLYWNVNWSFSSPGTRELTFKCSPSGASGSYSAGTKFSVTIQPSSAIDAYFVDADFGMGQARVNQAGTLNATTSETAKFLALFDSSGNKVKVWSAASNSTGDGENRHWTVPYTFAKAGDQSYTVKASTNGVYGKAASFSVTVIPPLVYNVQTTTSFGTGTPTAYEGEEVAFRVEADATAKFLAVFDPGDGDKKLKVWSATDYGTLEGDMMVFNVTLTITGTEAKSLRFCAWGGGAYGWGLSGHVDPRLHPVFSVAADKTAINAGGSITFTATTPVASRYLAMYSENGGKIKSWSASGNSSVKDGKRVWKVSYTFNGKGHRTMSFRASYAGNYGDSASASFEVK